MIAMIDSSTTNGHYNGTSTILPLCLVKELPHGLRKINLYLSLISKDCDGRILRNKTCFDIIRSI